MANEFEMLTPSKTVVVCEGVGLDAIGLRYRKDGELVHLRDKKGQKCFSCNSTEGVWTDSPSSHVLHKDKCERKKLTLA